MSGSSPHTWGILVLVLFIPRNLRFIPTYVGHTGFPWEKSKSKTVHPHIRGAYSTPILG